MGPDHHPRASQGQCQDEWDGWGNGRKCVPYSKPQVFHPVTSLFSQDLLDPELKIKARRLIDTIWLLSMRLGREVIKNNSSCHYPNNSAGLSDCNPIWPFVILSAAITVLRFVERKFPSKQRPNQSQGLVHISGRAGCGGRGRVPSELRHPWNHCVCGGRLCPWGGWAPSTGRLTWSEEVKVYDRNHLGEVYLCRWDKVSTPDWKKEGEERERGSEPKNPNA